MKIKFVFFGTDGFSVTILEALKRAGLLPALVVTQPDRPKGRGLVLNPPPAKEWAVAHNVPYLQPEKLHTTFNLKLSTFNFQLFVVASYGLIIPKATLDIPEHGTLNVHPSLLPKYRGATPIESQILNDEKEVGVTIMLMDAEMDHGPIVAQKKIPMQKVQNANNLQTVLANEGGALLAHVMPKWIAGKIEAMPQEHSKATYTKKFTKKDGEINLGDDPYQNFLKIQAFEDSIGTYFFVSDSPFVKGSTRLVGGEGFKSSVLEDSTTSFSQVGTKEKRTRVIIRGAEYRDGKLHILRVVPEGKKEMSYEEFLRGLK